MTSRDIREVREQWNIGPSSRELLDGNTVVDKSTILHISFTGRTWAHVMTAKEIAPLESGTRLRLREALAVAERERDEARLWQRRAEGLETDALSMAEEHAKEYKAEIASAESRASAAEALLKECEGVLEPLDKIANDYKPDTPDGHVITTAILMLGECRLASRLLARIREHAA